MGIVLQVAFYFISFMMSYSVTRSQSVFLVVLNLFWKTQKYGLHLLSFLNADTTQVVEILPQDKHRRDISTTKCSSYEWMYHSTVI